MNHLNRMKTFEDQEISSDDSDSTTTKIDKWTYEKRLFYKPIVLSKGSRAVDYVVAIHGDIKIKFESNSSIFNKTWIENDIIDI